MEDYQTLTPVQRVAHLAMWYDSEVQNGGHLQYFENRGTGHLGETLAALDTIGAPCQRAVLEAAGTQRLSRRRPAIRTVREFVSRARRGENADFDARYHQCHPTTHQLLEVYLAAHFDDFVELV